MIQPNLKNISLISDSLYMEYQKEHVCISLGAVSNPHKLTIDKCYYCILFDDNYSLINDIGNIIHCPKECFLPIREYNLSKLLDE